MYLCTTDQYPWEVPTQTFDVDVVPARSLNPFRAPKDVSIRKIDLFEKNCEINQLGT